MGSFLDRDVSSCWFTQLDLMIEILFRTLVLSILVQVIRNLNNY